MSEKQLVTPAYIRLPKSSSRCAFCGLSRSALNELILPTQANGFKPPVISRVYKKPGTSRGVRLIEVASLTTYLGQLPTSVVRSYSPRAPLDSKADAHLIAPSKNDTRLRRNSKPTLRNAPGTSSSSIKPSSLNS